MRTLYAFAVDWDGTCVTNAWPEMGEWLPGAVEALRRLSELGTVVIHTCRVAPVDLHTQGSREVQWRDEQAVTEEIRGIKKKLRRRGLDNIEVWTRPYKPPAFVYIDDRGLRFKGDWGVTLAQVEGLLGLEVPA